MRRAGCGKQPEDTGPCPSPATVGGTWATLLLPSWALPMSLCVRKLDKLENVKLVRGGKNLGKSQPDPQAQNTAAVHSQNQVREEPGLQELLGITGEPVCGGPLDTPPVTWLTPCRSSIL